MKICFVSPKSSNYLIDGRVGIGGAEHQMALLAEYFALDNEGSIIVNQDTDLPIHKGPLAIHQIRTGGAGRIVDLIRKIKLTKADYFIFRSSNAFLYPIGLFIKAFTKAKIHYMIANDWEIHDSDTRRIQGFWAAWGMKRFYRLCSTLNGQYTDQASSFEDKRKIKVHGIVPNYFPIEAYKGLEPISKKRTKILWVGRAANYKRPEIFLELAKSLPNLSFEMIMAPKPDPTLAKRIAEEAKIISNLNFTPGLPHVELIRNYREALAVVISSEFEGFSNVMMEGIANKVQVLILGNDPDLVLEKNQFGSSFDSAEELRKYLASNNFESIDPKQNSELHYLESTHSSKRIAKSLNRILSNS